MFVLVTLFFVKVESSLTSNLCSRNLFEDMFLMKNLEFRCSFIKKKLVFEKNFVIFGKSSDRK